MRKLKIGYVPISKDLSAPGDRRRVVFWVNARGQTLTTNLDSDVDLILLSENSDFGSELRSNRKTPVVFDLIDGYLSPTNIAEDLSRGIAKSLNGSISGRVKPFSHQVRNMCLNASGVICSSIEQAEVIRKYNSNVHIILDSHEEIPFLDFRGRKNSMEQEVRLLWEGQPATISGLNQLLPFLQTNLEFHLDLITDFEYFRFMNRYIKRDTTSLIKMAKSKNLDTLTLRNWSIQNLTDAAHSSTIGILPVNLGKPIMRMKPENRMLIMWRLGLPCLVSPLDSYRRVAKKAQVDAICSSNQEWMDRIVRLSTERFYANDQIEKAQSYLQEFHSKEILLAKWDHLARSVMEVG